MGFVFLILFGILIPLVLFYVCYKIKKVYLNIIIYVAFAVVVLVRNIFYMNFYNKQIPSIVEAVERIKNFLCNDSVLLLTYFIVPGCITCLMINVIYYIKKLKSN